MKMPHILYFTVWASDFELLYGSAHVFLFVLSPVLWSKGVGLIIIIYSSRQVDVLAAYSACRGCGVQK